MPVFTKDYKARGIVLHTVKYGERSLVVYLLTDSHGRQSYMAYKRSPLFNPMFLIGFEGSSSPRAEMHRFGEMAAAAPMRSIPFDARKSTISLFMAEIIYRLVREQEPNPALFEFVWSSVEQLDNMVEGVANFHLWFLVGLSRHLGFAPSGEWTPGSWFDIREGVFTPIRPKHGLAFSHENTALLWELMNRQPGEIGLNRERRGGFLNAMIDYLGYHFDAATNIRSVDILREVF